MITACLLSIALSVAPDAGEVEVAQRKYHDISGDMRTWLRLESQAETPQQRVAAVHRLSGLYRELISDSRLPESPTLQGYRAKLWKRLTDVKQRLEREIRQAGRLPRMEPKGGASVSSPEPGAEASLSSGPTGRGGAAVTDYGPALVRLIERTLSPEFWDSQGGPGTIVYYQPLQAIVVRATTEVHHNVGRAWAPYVALAVSNINRIPEPASTVRQPAEHGECPLL